MVSPNSVKNKDRNLKQKKRSTASKSVTRKRKSAQKKGKKGAYSVTKMDLSERRRRARERQKQARQAEDVVNLSSQKSKPVKREKPQSGITRSFLLLIRLVILAVGVGAISGTILAFFASETYLSDSSSINPEEATETELTTDTESPPPPPPLLPLNQEITDLKQTFERLGSEQDQLNPTAFIIDVDSGEYVDLQGNTTVSAASTIKLPILIAFFYAWEQGELELDERLTMTEDVKVGEAGRMQYDDVGTEYVALETATEMIRISDNTATNMIMKRVGGKEVLNQLFAQWGLEKTRIRDQLPDVEGTNTTSPKEMVELLVKLEKGELLSARSRDKVFEILQTTETDSLLPQGLGDGATIAHKTGHIGSVVGDVGIINRPNGQRYFAAILVERPHNDSHANELIRNYSQHTYQYFEH
ncbi:serine hydrolase [Euhalothece natronophila]|nr:serine hydrolase [Euhalothece natronophila]